MISYLRNVNEWTVDEVTRSIDQCFPWLVLCLSGPLVIWSRTGSAGLTAASLVACLVP